MENKQSENSVGRKEFRGTVVSTKMQDTAVVAISRYVKHPKYKKYMKHTKKLSVHNPGNKAKEGDLVTIHSCRPLSKTKHFEIVYDANPQMHSNDTNKDSHEPIR